MSLVLKNVNIIDATTPEVRTERNVLVVHGVIQQVTSGPAPDADQVVDLDGAYLLPGLWDVHTHLNKGTYGHEAVEEDALDLIPRVLAYARNSMDALNMGVTSLRTVGVQEWADVALRNAFSAGQFKGPRLFCGGHALNTTAGHMADVDTPIDGPVAFIHAVRNEIMHYVNHIKLGYHGRDHGLGARRDDEHHDAPRGDGGCTDHRQAAGDTCRSPRHRPRGHKVGRECRVPIYRARIRDG